MNTAALLELHDAITDRLSAGDEAGAMEILRARFKELPESAQGAVLARPFIDAVKEETERIETLNELKSEAIAGIKILEVLKAEIAKGTS